MLEARALAAPAYDLERFGLRFVDSPRQADVLLVTGAAARNMSEALARAWTATPEPKWVVAVGDCAGGTGPSPAAMPWRKAASVPCCRWT
ncbi:hypothetical protein ACFQU7_00315 [Pseudoroseomonas wenyumeiae]